LNLFLLCDIFYIIISCLSVEQKVELAWKIVVARVWSKDESAPLQNPQTQRVFALINTWILIQKVSMYTCILIHVSNKCKLRCVLMPLLLAHSHSHHVNSFAISLPVASRKPMIVRHCHSLKTWQLTLSSDKLTVDAVSKVESGPTATTLWLEPLLPHNPPDLSISTSPDSYPTSRWWHSILADVWVLL